MGQIQNAILNSLGSVQQMAQLYKLTKSQLDAAKQSGSDEATKKFETTEAERIRRRTAGQAQADILATPFTKEEEERWEQEFRGIEAKTSTTRGEKGNLTKSINAYPGEFTDPEYIELVRQRGWLDKKYPAGTDKKAKASKSPQEQADNNDNIKKAKEAAKGGKK